MLGLAVAPGELETATEFFELFKTPWEPVVPGRSYRAILTTDPSYHHRGADVVVAYRSSQACHDGQPARTIEGPVDVQWRGSTFPVYGWVSLFTGVSPVDATCMGQGVEWEGQRDGQTLRVVGYDLFREVRRLLTDGQPVQRAAIPTLELHIALLRAVLLSAGVPFVEIPPRPFGYDFICCLTHDLDFFGIRRHKFDRTLLGFLLRATLGTLLDLIRGRRSSRDAIKNWAAVLALPLVFAGVIRDLWRPFDDYSSMEAPERSTFFLVPFKGRPGAAPDGMIDPRRAVAYQISDVRDAVTRAVERGSEVALHGIDAWRDSAAGSSELRALVAVTGHTSAGVRMHWLYFDAGSPARLEAAGFAYDSTWGYNDAVGYRAGTSQVFRLSGTRALLELPLSLMDSALFYPDRMNLTRREALRVCKTILENAARFGGTVVVNWHDRSLAPERLWGACYRALLLEVERHRVWFAQAGEAVEWYRWRRSIHFVRQDSGVVAIVGSRRDPSLPGAVLKTYRPTASARGYAAEERLNEHLPAAASL